MNTDTQIQSESAQYAPARILVLRPSETFKAAGGKQICMALTESELALLGATLVLPTPLMLAATSILGMATLGTWASLYGEKYNSKTVFDEITLEENSDQIVVRQKSKDVPGIRETRLSAYWATAQVIDKNSFGHETDPYILLSSGAQFAVLGKHLPKEKLLESAAQINAMLDAHNGPAL